MLQMCRVSVSDINEPINPFNRKFIASGVAVIRHAKIASAGRYKTNK